MLRQGIYRTEQHFSLEKVKLEFLQFFIVKYRFELRAYTFSSCGDQSKTLCLFSDTADRFSVNKLLD